MGSAAEGKRLSPVDVPILTRSSGIVCKLQGIFWLMTLNAAVSLQGEQKAVTEHLWEERLLMVRGSEMGFPRFTCCFLLDRKSEIHLQVECGTPSWKSLSWSRAGMITIYRHVGFRGKLQERRGSVINLISASAKFSDDLDWTERMCTPGSNAMMDG